MTRFIPFFLAGALLVAACRSDKPVDQSQAQSADQTTQEPTAAPPDKPPPPPENGPSASDVKELYFYDIFARKPSLSYKGYKAEIRDKAVKDETTPGRTIPITYATIRKGGKRLDTFDGMYFGLGNATKMGLFNFLGGSTKQLAISQTLPREGRHWIVRLSPSYKVLFDSHDYEAVREDVEIRDYDHDGIYEIGLALLSLDLVFQQFSMAETPLPFVVFKFDRKTNRYLPASHLFQEQLLGGLHERIRDLREDPKAPGYLSARVDILLEYLYAGKEREGWAFFDRAYDQPDKAAVIAKVKGALRKSPVYQYIRAHAQRSSR